MELYSYSDHDIIIAAKIMADISNIIFPEVVAVAGTGKIFYILKLHTISLCVSIRTLATFLNNTSRPTILTQPVYM